MVDEPALSVADVTLGENWAPRRYSAELWAGQDCGTSWVRGFTGCPKRPSMGSNGGPHRTCRGASMSVAGVTGENCTRAKKEQIYGTLVEENRKLWYNKKNKKKTFK